MSEREPPLLHRFDDATHDPDVAHDAIRDAYVDFTVRLSGSTENFAFSHTGTVAPGFIVARVHYGMAAEIDAEVAQDMILVNSPASGSEVLQVGNERVAPSPGDLLLLPPDQAGWRIAMENLTVDAVGIDRDTVVRTATAAYGIGGTPLSFASTSPVSEGAARYWRSVVDHVRHEVLDRDEVAGSPLVLAEARRMLAVALLTAFPLRGVTHMRPRPDRAEPAVLRRATAYIEEHAHTDVPVQDIADAARVSVRGLEILFRRHRDQTPLQYLRQVRLSGAHRDLLVADPTRGDTVVAVAARWGFTHPGRFSTDYRRAYGCSPSETLRR